MAKITRTTIRRSRTSGGAAKEGERRHARAPGKSALSPRARTGRSRALADGGSGRSQYGRSKDERSRRGPSKSDRPNGHPRSHKKHGFKKRFKTGPWDKTAFSIVTPKAVASSQNPSAAAQGGGELERLHKVIASAGVASRREAERLILEGAVTVNGALVTQLGVKVDAKKDKIKVNGEMLMTEVDRVYAVFYKPRGVIAALKDPEGRTCLAHYLASVNERVVPVGQMDFNSEGLLLLTNDGDLVNQITKKKNLPKVYLVKVKGHPSAQTLSALRDGIFSAEGVVRFADLRVKQELENKSWLKLEVTEGSRLDLRELLNRRGLLVDRIIRTAVGQLTVQGMQPGEIKYVKRKDFSSLVQY